MYFQMLTWPFWESNLTSDHNKQLFGIKDGWRHFMENYSQWAICIFSSVRETHLDTTGCYWKLGQCCSIFSKTYRLLTSLVQTMPTSVPQLCSSCFFMRAKLAASVLRTWLDYTVIVLISNSSDTQGGCSQIIFIYVCKLKNKVSFHPYPLSPISHGVDCQFHNALPERSAGIWL